MLFLQPRPWVTRLSPEWLIEGFVVTPLMTRWGPRLAPGDPPPFLSKSPRGQWRTETDHNQLKRITTNGKGMQVWRLECRFGDWNAGLEVEWNGWLMVGN